MADIPGEKLATFAAGTIAQSGQPENPDQSEIARLRSKHEDYEKLEDHWKFMLLSYEGGPDYVSEDTLFKHQREHQDDYQDRLKRAHYANYCQSLVDFVPQFIYEKAIDRQPSPALKTDFDRFFPNVDRCGNDLTAFMRELAEMSRVFGLCYVQVDKLPVPEGVDPATVSVQQGKELGIDMPYFVKVSPLEVLDWGTDAFGNYSYLKRQETYVERDELNPGSSRRIERFSEWTRRAVKISRVDITESQPKLLGQIVLPNKWGQVPFVPVLYKRSKTNKDQGISFLQDIAYQNRQVFNLSSLLDEFLYRQCFNILVVERDTSVPTAESVDGDVGTSNYMEVSRGVGHMPAYLSPEVDPAAFIQDERAISIQEMYRQAAQDISNQIFPGGLNASPGSSGDAQKQSFGNTVPVIARMADMLQQAEVNLFKLWAKMTDREWEGRIAYKDDYGVTNLQDLLLQLTTIFNNLKVLSPTFIREEWLRIVREFDGRIEPDKMAEIIKEIEEMSDDELVGLYKVAPGDVKAAAGLPSTSNMMQGQAQKQLGTDRKISMATGSRASTKEANPDVNRRATGARSQKR